MTNKIISLIVLGGLILAPLRVGAYSGESLVITQIQVSGTGGANDEFIEIFNPTLEPVELDGWSIQYKSSTGAFPLSTKKVLPDFALEPGKYFLIAHTNYSGTVAGDLLYSTFTLSGSATGATVFLSKTSDFITSATDVNIVDKVGYGTSLTNSPETMNALLPESGKSLQRQANENNNSLDFVVDSSEPKNNAYESDSEEIPDEDVEEEPDPTEIEEEEPEPIIYPDGIIISEIMANPEGVDIGEEWIELANTSNETIQLEGWILDDSLIDVISSKHLELGEIEVDAGKYVVVPIPEGKFTLNNTNEEKVRLYWPNKEPVDQVEYTGPVKEEQTWCKLDTDYQWCKSTPNKVNAKIEVAKSTTKTTMEKEEDEDDEEVIVYSKDVKIVELLPDPDGADSGNEIIKLFNQGNKSVSLNDWVLDDGEVGDALGSSAYKITVETLAMGEEIEITIPTGKFAMNNSGSDTVRLFSPDKKLQDSVTYDSSEEGQVYIKYGDDWTWSGLVLGESTSEDVLDDTLPRTGMNIHMFSFATLVAIWYIVYGFRIKKGIHEQTRSYRCTSS